MHTILSFYDAFARGDWAAMADFYAPHAVFNDPAFGELHGAEIGAMWRMLIERSRGALKISVSDIRENRETGAALWTAVYVFSQTGRPVTNVIRAAFEFENGKIKRHTDDFDLWKWSRQAMGWKGALLGWTGFFRRALQEKARAQLFRFIEKTGSA